MKKWILLLAVACGVAFAVWAGRAGVRRHGTGALPTEERGYEAEGAGRTLGASGRGEGSSKALSESGNGGKANGHNLTDRPSCEEGKEASGKQSWEQDEWDFGPEGEIEGRDREESDNRMGEGGNERLRTFGSAGAGRVSGVEENVVSENGEEAESSGVSAEEAERIFAANDAASATARELRREAAKEDEEEKNAESRPPLWIVRSLVWNDEVQEMEVSFRFGEMENANGVDGETGGGVENGILLQRIPPGWEVESSSPAADAFAAGSRKLKWLMSGGPVAGREISLQARPAAAGADPGDWDLAATWFTCRWNGKACLVQPEIGGE